ncbi:phospholipase D-like domain-containing protein [Glycomyces sp. NPDC046736]|uniref:phospholipase D-like domain-containing protein n=1 Tax=Glycomyces sp. NPDC046736 TaxID=3155615 RepID=UPI0033EDBD03
MDLIDGAERKVFVATWMVGDPELLDTLYRAADRLQGGVYVIAAMNERDLAKAYDEEDTEVAPAERMRERKQFEALTQNGIAVRTYNGCHAKFVVVDDRSALVSSANLVPRALDLTGENGVLLTDHPEAERAARLFARLWADCEQELPLSGDRVLTDVRGPRTHCRLEAPNPGENGLIWTHGRDHRILAAVHELIAAAESELLLATFSLNGIADHPSLLLEPLRTAVDRGVDVRMLVRGRDRPDHLDDAAALAEAGVNLFPCSLNHAKGIIADRERGALFSANFDAAHGLTGGVELGMRLDGTPALAEALRYFEHAIAEHDRELMQPVDGD